LLLINFDVLLRASCLLLLSYGGIASDQNFYLVSTKQKKKNKINNVVFRQTVKELCVNGITHYSALELVYLRAGSAVQ
jgi:hypothetical protein